MFGKRGNDGFGKGGAVVSPPAPQFTPAPAASTASEAPIRPPASAENATMRQPVAPPPLAPAAPARKRPARNDQYYDTKSQVFSALIDTIDLSQLAKLDNESARENGLV